LLHDSKDIGLQAIKPLIVVEQLDGAFEFVVNGKPPIAQRLFKIIRVEAE
jgi:hypothetical protein